MMLSEIAPAGSLFTLVPLVVFIPLLGLLINMIFGGRMSERLIGIVASTASGLTIVVAVILMAALTGVHEEPMVVPFLEWIHIGSFAVDWTFRVDTLSVVMMLVVSVVGTLIHIYAIGYMHEDVRHNGDPSRFRRFFVFLNLFIAMMMILVSADNYLMLFVGWEGVGLCSYLLIGFWYDKGKDGIGNALAGNKAFIVNRIGDVGMLLAMFTIFWVFGTLTFDQVFEKAPEIASATPIFITMITLFMLVGVTGKSAQLPLYVWLPDAMAGPTPVSALIHAATMVTAGVYLIARSAPLYSLAPGSQNIVAWVGGLTALFAATIAVGQYDIKKVLAYSTVSQLGFMVAAVGMGAYVAGMFHLVAHAFFKALLFLGSGSVIQGMERGEHHLHHHAEEQGLKPKKKKTKELPFDPQDMRFMGGLRGRMKITFWVYIIASLALAGIPPLVGFWSKDEILLEADHLNFPVYILLTLAAILTAFYIGRQVWLVFFGKPRSEAAGLAEESPPVMTVPLMILAFFTLVGGGLNLPRLLFFKDWLKYAYEAVGIELEVIEFSLRVALISTVLALVAIGLSYWLYGRKPLEKGQEDPLRRPLGPVFAGMENKWWVDELYHFLIVNPYIKLSHILADYVDWRFWHDWFHEVVLAGGYKAISRFMNIDVDTRVIDGIANALGRGTQRLADRMRGIQTGYLRNYALMLVLGVVIIIGYFILR
ncbi:MAG: NADH-quinone oxidoreductase subunit L [Anaerolineales bacterium]